MFCLVLVAGTLGSTAVGHGRSPIASSLVYGIVLPALLRACLVALPAIAGMARGVRCGPVPSRHLLAGHLLGAVALVLLTGRAMGHLEASLVGAWWASPIEPGHQAVRLLLAAALTWPAVYMATRALAERSLRHWPPR